MRERLRAAISEWRADRAGRVRLSNDIAMPTREITGPTGFVNSPTWDSMTAGREAYTRSFDPRVPPSLHISQRDGARRGAVIPLAERCIEDRGRRADPGRHEGSGDESEDTRPHTK